MNRITQIITLFMLAIAGAFGAENSAKETVRDEIKAIIEEGHYPGVSILLIHQGEVIMREAHGVVDIETKEPFSVDQLCWLASTGKIFTATLMAKLVDDKVLSFDEPIADTFPDFANIQMREGRLAPKVPILLRHALSHTTGLPGKRWMAENGLKEDDPANSSYVKPENPQDFIDGCLKIGLVAEPGKRMIYGRPIDLSASVSEKRTGKPFTQLMEEKVFAPLGLKNTTIRPTAEELKNLAPLYQSTEPGVFEDDDFGLQVAERQNHRLSTAGGGVYSTLDDLGVLMQLHLNRGKHNGVQIVNAKTLSELYQPQPGTNGRYGLAFQIMKSTINGESTLYNHPGYSGPVAWFDFERQLACVILMQSNTVGRGKHHQRIIDRIHEMIPAVKKEVAVKAEVPKSEKIVVLTFDDSVKSHATFVAPLLKEYGFGATFFITEGFQFLIDKKHYMTWEQIKALNDAGFEIGNHTRKHSSVKKQTAEKLTADIKHIEDRCEEYGIPMPVSFCYPGYQTSDAATKILRERGYQFARAGGATAFDPETDDPLLIPQAFDGKPESTLEQFEAAVASAGNGKIAVMTFHGVPDIKHPWVDTTPEKFKAYMKHLKDENCTVIAMRDLEKVLSKK